MTKDVVARDGKSPEDVDLSKPTDPEEAAKEPESSSAPGTGAGGARAWRAGAALRAGWRAGR